MATYRSFSSASTRFLGEKLAKKISNLKIPAGGEARYGRQNSKPQGATVIALSGELGAGKTTFVQGFCQGLGIKKWAVSPTFIIFRRFEIKDLRFKFLYHVDVYRIKKANELSALGLEKIMADPQNIVLIEWAENVKKILPRGSTWIRFRHGKKANVRTLKIQEKAKTH